MEVMYGSLRNGSMVMAKKIVFEIIADSDCTTLKTWKKVIFRKGSVCVCLSCLLYTSPPQVTSTSTHSWTISPVHQLELYKVAAWQCEKMCETMLDHAALTEFSGQHWISEYTIQQIKKKLYVEKGKVWCRHKFAECSNLISHSANISIWVITVSYTHLDVYKRQVSFFFRKFKLSSGVPVCFLFVLLESETI